MENLNAERIQKELALFIDDMPVSLHFGLKKTVKFRDFLKEALALIKSQEQQIDALYRLVDDKIQENKRLTEENERLIVTLKMNDAPFPEGLQIVHDFCEKGKRAAEADTVRKMQERLKTQKFTHKNLGELVYVEDIDRIAKEMEDKKE